MRLESRGVIVGMDGVEPYALGQGSLNHRCVVCRVERAEAGSKRSHSLGRVHFQRYEVDGNRIARYSAFDKERTRERVVALNERQRIAGLLNGVAESVKRVRLEKISRREMCDGRV